MGKKRKKKFKILRPHKLCKLILGDSSKPLPFKDGTFDTIITDPPYGLKFMNAKWDYNIPSVDVWKEVLRVSKPGATLLCFAGTRTQHRMACAIEDAGWRLFDCIMWMYGTGFPKAADISKQIDKMAGVEREVIGKKFKGSSPLAGNHSGDWTDGQVDGEFSITAPSTEEAILWNGWKSHGLKPAYEPIICAMKPNEGTYAQNALKHGVAGLNIDGGRVPGIKPQTIQGVNSNPSSFNVAKTKQTSGDPNEGRFPANVILGCACEDPEEHDPDCACALLDEQSGQSKSSGGDGSKFPPPHFGMAGDNITPGGKGFKDVGGASRFFYCAKAARKERDQGLEDLESSSPGEITGGRKKGSAGLNDPRAGAGRTSGGRNTHPTVKPLALMRYLCKLTATPTCGKVLDPFCGSGTMGIAAVLEGRKSVLIERDKKYVRIAYHRIRGAENES